MCKGSSTNIIDMVMTSFPLLEAMGNAKTLRNNNSSRYGKWMEMYLDDKSKIVGCTLASYLLEKSRVATQIRSERKYCPCSQHAIVITYSTTCAGG